MCVCVGGVVIVAAGVEVKSRASSMSLNASTISLASVCDLDN